MYQETARKKDLEDLNGRILKKFSLVMSYDEFVNSKKFKNVKNFAFVIALISMMLGLLLPLFVGFISALEDYGTEAFQVNMISNAILSIVFCMPLSFVFIVGAIPLYNKIVGGVLEFYGYTSKQKTLKRKIA